MRFGDDAARFNALSGDVALVGEVAADADLTVFRLSARFSFLSADSRHIVDLLSVVIILVRVDAVEALRKVFKMMRLAVDEMLRCDASE